MRTLPECATDAHVQVFEQGRSIGPPAPLGPEPGETLSHYCAEMERVGLRRAVVVQPAAYGTDNSGTLAAVAALGPLGRGVAILSEKVSDRELELMEAQGITGLRSVLDHSGGMGSWEALERLAPRAAEHGWHIDLQIAGRDWPAAESRLRALPGSLVVEHAGLLDPPDPAGEGAASLLRLLDSGRVWVKLSAPYLSSRTGPPDYPDFAALVGSLIRHAPDRCLWASNWPHPGRHPRPDTLDLLSLTDSWCPDESAWTRVLETNAALLYGFAASASAA